MRYVCALAMVVAACSNAEPGAVTLTTYPVRVLADGRASTTVTVTIRGRDGHPLAQSPVAISVTGSDNTLGALTGVTDDDGVLVTTLRSTSGETKTVTATAADHTGTHEVTFMPMPPCPGIPRIGTVPALPTNLGALGDLDEDGKLDAIVLGSSNGFYGVMMLPGLGDGTFADPVFLAALPFDEEGDALRVADVDNDGHLDIAVASPSPSSGPPANVTLLMGNGDGTMRTPVAIPVADHATSVAFGDFDGDGHLDIAAGTFSLAQQTVGISVLFGHGDGTFEPYSNVATFPSTANDLSMVEMTGDLDGDGRADLVAWEYYSTTLHVFYGNAERTFYSAASIEAPNSLSEQMVTVADVNADARADLVINTLIGLTANTELDVLLGQSDRTFARLAATTWSGSGEIPEIIAIDVDGDGKIDLIRTDDYLRGNGDGTFVQGPTYSAFDGSDMQVGDIDGNGSIDVVHTRKIYLNDHGTFRVPATYDQPGSILYAVGDFDNDGVVDIVQENTTGVIAARRGHGDGTFDTGFALSGAGMSGAQVGDVNRDGNADIVLRSEDGTVSVELGNGDGTFDLVPTTAMLPGVIWHLVDLNGDGKLDVASGISVLPGVGDGTFGPLITSDAGYLPDFRGGYADINADGFPDLIVFDSINTNQSAVYFGNGDGTFQKPEPLPERPGGIEFVAADFNNDGLVDLVDGGDPPVLIGHPDGTFGAPASTEPWWGLTPMAAVDLDRDGNLDLVSGDGSLSLGDGSGGFKRPFAYVDGGTPVDVDGDGMIDLLNGWQFARQQGCFQ